MKRLIYTASLLAGILIGAWLEEGKLNKKQKDEKGTDRKTILCIGETLPGQEQLAEKLGKQWTVLNGTQQGILVQDPFPERCETLFKAEPGIILMQYSVTPQTAGSLEEKILDLLLQKYEHEVVIVIPLENDTKQAIQELAGQYGLRVIDLNALIMNHPEYIDGDTIKSGGASAVADMIFREIF